MDLNQQNYQSRKEEREKLKAEERRKKQRERLWSKFKIYALVVVIIAAIGYGIFLLARSANPQGEDFSQAIPVMENRGHIAVGADKSVQYNSNPPTSGPHYGQTAQSGFRETSIPDGNIIHNLEHGDVWISYHPRLSQEIKEALKQFAAAKVIITPREANDTDIALASWGRLDAFNIENEEVPVLRIKNFIKRYTNKGPEFIPGSSGGI